MCSLQGCVSTIRTYVHACAPFGATEYHEKDNQYYAVQAASAKHAQHYGPNIYLYSASAAAYFFCTSRASPKSLRQTRFYIFFTFFLQYDLCSDPKLQKKYKKYVKPRLHVQAALRHENCKKNVPPTSVYHDDELHCYARHVSPQCVSTESCPSISTDSRNMTPARHPKQLFWAGTWALGLGPGPWALGMGLGLWALGLGLGPEP